MAPGHWSAHPEPVTAGPIAPSPATAGLRVLFLTSARGTEDVLAGFDAGGDDYILKPFAMAELLARMQAVLRRWGRVGRTIFHAAEATG